MRALLPLAGVLALALGVLGVFGGTSSGEAEPQATASGQASRNAYRARATYHAMQKRLWNQRTLRYKGTGNLTAWPYGRALAATLAIAELPGASSWQRRGAIRARVKGLTRFWTTSHNPPAYSAGPQPPWGRGGEIYYDDNEWIGLELLRAYRLTHDRSMLAQAKRVLRLVTSGWDRTAKTCPGGVMWTTDPKSYQRGTVTNGPGAQLALGIYELTHRRGDLIWAQRMWGWADRCMRDPRTGLYQDHFRRDGSRDTTIWSYNQGTMFASALRLHDFTGSQEYLNAARRIATASFDYFDDSRMLSARPYFLSIYFRELLPFERTQDGTQFRDKLQRYADYAWKNLRDPSTGLFDRSPDSRGKVLLTQASMAEIYALLARH